MPKVKKITTYPIKSCGDTGHNSVLVAKYGLLNDRMFMVVDANGRMMTQREHPRMCLISVKKTGTFTGTLCLVDASVGPTFSMHETHGLVEREVTVFKDTVSAFDQGDEVAKWLTDYLNTPCRLVRKAEKAIRNTKRGEGQVAFADAYAVLGASAESLGHLNGRIALPIPMNRFRPNLVFEDTEPFAEDSWRRVRIGGIIDLTGETLCARCSIPQVDQETGKMGKEPAKALSRYRKAEHLAGIHAAWKLPYPGKVYFGRNFNVSGTGIIIVGMEVEVLEVD